MTNKIKQMLRYESQETVCNRLVDEFPIKAIIRSYVKLVAESEWENVKIPVSREEFEAIMNLFRVKGERVINGEITMETRGRKRKDFKVNLEE